MTEAFWDGGKGAYRGLPRSTDPKITSVANEIFVLSTIIGDHVQPRGVEEESEQADTPTACD